MKKIIYLLILMPFICIGNKDSSSTPKVNKDSITHDKGRILTQYNGIYFIDACNYLYNLLHQTNLKYQARHLSVGGFIPISAFPKSLTVPAMRFYPCLNEVTNDVFLTWSKDEEIEIEDTECIIDTNKIFYRDSLSIRYQERCYGYEDIISFFSREYYDNGKSIGEVKPSSIEKWNNAFRNKYSYTVTNQNNIKNITKCNGFSSNDFKELRTQNNGDLLGIMYFFGFDNERDCNNIRIFFMAVSKQGYILLNQSNGDPAVMLERDWPNTCPQ